MSTNAVVVIGASAGGVEALQTVVGGLPADLPAPVLIVLHTAPGGFSALPSILSRAGQLPAGFPRDGEAMSAGRIYIAPPDYHLLIRDGHLELSDGPRENNHRPAIDPLFRSAARTHGSAVIGVVLSGTLDDGASGLAAIVRHGGSAVVQDPAHSLYRGMPEAAVRAVGEAALVVRASAIPDAIAGRLARRGPDGVPAGPDHLLDREIAIAEFDLDQISGDAQPGTPAGLGCPDCHGSLFAIQEGSMVRYRCRVGHAWSPESLLARHDTAVESALWTALRTVEDKAALHRRIAASATENQADRVAGWNLRSAHDLTAAARVLRDVLRQPKTE